MNFIKYILLNSLAYGMLIKNTQKFCVNCKYFVLHKVYDNYDNSIIGERSSCSKFVTKNLISGRMKEELALECRNNEKMCGIDAKYFTLKNSTQTNRNACEDVKLFSRASAKENTLDKHIFIKNNNNICIDCKFGVPHIPNDPFEERDPIDYNFKCQKFVTTDIVSGKDKNKLANICRSNEELCGTNAKYFIKK